MFHRSLSIAAAVLVAIPMLCLAQQNPGRPPERPDQDISRRDISRRPRTSDANSDANDELINYLAGKIMLANQVECQLAKTAAEKSKNPDVQRFAQQLQTDYQQFNEKLQQQMPQLAAMVDLGTSSANVPRVPADASATQQPEGQQAGSQGKPLDGPARRLMRITQQAAQNEIEMINDLMSQYQGQDFDMAFLGQQISGSTWMVAELKAIQKVGPDALQSLAQAAQQLTERDLDQARQLAKRLEDDRARPSQQNRQSVGQAR